MSQENVEIVRDQVERFKPPASCRPRLPQRTLFGTIHRTSLMPRLITE